MTNSAMTAAPALTALDVAQERVAVLTEARSWLGTPFHHASRLKGVGVDCAQFLMACYIGRGVVDPFDPGYYAPDWFLHEDGERFRGWIERSCIATETPKPGDVVLFRYGRAESHGAVYVGGGRLIHAFRGRGVVEDACGAHTPLGARRSSAWTPARWVLELAR